MNKRIKETIKHSSIAFIVSLILALLITWARTNPNNSFEMAWMGVVVCLMLTINYIRNWKLQYVESPIPTWLSYFKKNWAWELIHFVTVNVAFIIPLIIFKSF